MRRAFLVRHGRAGSRTDFAGRDALRPLDAKGRRQALALSRALAGHGALDRLLSSPARRCLETLAPLGDLTGRPVEEAGWLAEGSDPLAAVEQLRAIEEAVVVCCSHGDVIWGILEWAARGGVRLGDHPDAAKASTWILDWPDEPAEGVPLRAGYLPPPAELGG